MKTQEELTALNLKLAKLFGLNLPENHPGGEAWGIEITDYSRDLNAVHELFKTFTASQLKMANHYLKAAAVIEGFLYPFMAEASHLTEVYLKVKQDSVAVDAVDALISMGYKKNIARDVVTRIVGKCEGTFTANEVVQQALRK